MIAIAAAAAFVGLFALWVILPRFILRRHDNSAGRVSPSPIPQAQDDFAPQAAD